MADVTRTAPVTRVVEPEKFTIELTREEAGVLRDTLGKTTGSFDVFNRLDDLLGE